MTTEKKLEIFNAIIALGDIWGGTDKVEMLNRIWNLRLLSSEDPRYDDAYGDAVKHLRDNDDWEDEYVFLTRFGLQKADDEVFFKFLNEVVSTKVRKTKDEILLYANAITRLMRILFEICNEFNSACIIATHSAVIQQELLARNVTVVEQDADTQEPNVRGMNTETLGENLTTITEDIFGRASIDKHYGEVIQQLIHKGKNGEEIEQTLKTDGLPMSLNLYMYMRRLLEQVKADD